MEVRIARQTKAHLNYKFDKEKDFMQLAVTWTAEKRTFAPLIFTGDIGECFRKASEIGYQGVEMSIRRETDVAVQTVIDAMDRYNLKVSAVGTGLSLMEDGLSFSNHDENIRKAAGERFNEQISFAAKLNAPVILGLIHGKLSPCQDTGRREREWICDVSRSSALYAKELGVDIIIEPINRYETNFINSINEALDFITEIGTGNLGVMADAFHMNIEEIDISDSLRLASKNLIYVHLSDSNRWRPGGGHLNFKTILDVLREIDYKGFMSMEFLPGADADASAKEAYDFIIKQLVKLEPVT
jgi:5-keto-L-gluconate epimerase